LIDKLRFILNTHEQICHPIYLSLLVHDCSSYEEKSVSQLVSCLEDKLEINQRACEFLIYWAQKMEILEKNLHWATRGWVISRLPSLKTKKYFLTPEEKVAYLKYYLDSDGALIINFLKELLELGENGLSMADFLNDRGVERVFTKTAEEYMAEVFEISPRYELSKLLSAGEKGYSSKVRTDKFLPHIQPLVDLGFIERRDTGNLIRYIPHITQENGFNINSSARFLDEFNSVLALDDIFSQTGNFYEKAAVSFGLKVERTTSNDFSTLQHEIIKAYDEVKDEDFRLARLESIYDLVCIRLLFSPYYKLCEIAEVSKTIQNMNKIAEDKIRFHVDDMGATKYVTISKDYVLKELNQKM
jgi:hypothetical protein